MRKVLFLTLITLVATGCYSPDRQRADVSAGRYYYLKTSMDAIQSVHGIPDDTESVDVRLRGRFGIPRIYPGVRHLYRAEDRYFDYANDRYVAHGRISSLVAPEERIHITYEEKK